MEEEGEERGWGVLVLILALGSSALVGSTCMDYIIACSMRLVAAVRFVGRVLTNKLFALIHALVLPSLSQHESTIFISHASKRRACILITLVIFLRTCGGDGDSIYDCRIYIIGSGTIHRKIAGQVLLLLN